ncbi:AMP-binding protein [Actinomadura livida]|uniref:ATP-dependent acyl-CoA ligase n=1 Tax=Actinomadura livida TaxID=79909 RepID=A0A7W7MYH0_9ACTN|nr:MULTISPECIES: AMP-binding protein [Actinomadura]MBB4774830.1 crotonobetaine/carnitine-CoA ligase [Actinomadura catellatispora]GGU05710.1 ATP-dependent acyl-CoA ligase [Actinomadura livida]
MADEVTTIPAQLAARVAADPDAHLAAAGGGWTTVAEVQDRARRLAAGLHGLGVSPGDRVASIMQNRPEAIDLFFACAELGAVQVPLNVFLKGEFLRYQLADADPGVLVVDAAAFDMATRLVSDSGMDIRVVALDGTGSDTGTGADVVAFQDLALAPERTWPEPGPDSLLSILYTSGTTGLPKGCMINQGYFLHMPKAHMRFGWFKPSDTSITTLPLYHGFGLSALMDALVAECRVAFEPEFRASTLIARAREVGATQLWAVGAIGAALLAAPPSEGDRDHELERAVFIPMAPGPQHEFERRFGVHVLAEGYGQTEVLPATMDGVREGRDRPSCGKALPWLDVQVVDDGDNVLPAGEVGEIVVRPLEPYSIFSGYWRNEAATMDAWRNLWHHTGDLGSFDEEGTLHFVDRKKDALRRRGENVSSVELEAAIVRHPGIAQAAVHAAPSELSEDEIKACLVFEPGADPAPEELFEYFRENLPYYAVPRYVEVMDGLPVNAMGRVQKHKLREAWNAPRTLDFQDLGLTIDKSSRR